jgi:hypothetical protein
MSRETLSERFRVDIGRTDGGQSFVRVNDTLTGLSRTQVGLDGEPADAITRRLASQIVAESGSLVHVDKIFMVDICRDGGSYSLCFYSTDGEWYEFFVPIKWDGDVAVAYETPRLYFRSVNDGNLVRTFAWEEAQQFVAPLQFDNSRFRELVDVLQNRGRFPPHEINAT